MFMLNMSLSDAVHVYVHKHFTVNVLKLGTVVALQKSLDNADPDLKECRKRKVFEIFEHLQYV